MALIKMTHPDFEGVGEIDETVFPEFAAKGWVRVEPPTDAAPPRTKTVRRPAVATDEKE